MCDICFFWVFFLQVILVQVNPGETFTIRTEDGALQCIQGPAEVPMMSPNGSIPPIHVPPGYVSQVTDRNGSGPCISRTMRMCFHPSEANIPFLVFFWWLQRIQHSNALLSLNESFQMAIGDILYTFWITLDLTVCVFYRVSTVCNSVKGPSFDAWAFTTHSAPPDTPPPPRLSHRTKSSLTLQWKVCMTELYLIHLCLCSESQWMTLYRGPERKHLCEDLKPATSYSLRLSCVNVGGQSLCSDDLTVRTHIPPPGRCQPPSIVGDVKHKEMTLQWDGPLCGEESENVEFSLEMCAMEEGSEPTEVYCGPKTECTVGNLLPGTTHRFQVRAANSAGYGPYSESVEISTGAGPPGQCSPPAINVTSHTCADVTWENKVSSGIDISEYRLDWGCDLDSLELVYSGTETCFQIFNLEASTYYCCRLQAVNQAGAGPYSDLVMCRTPAVAPDVVSGFRYVDHPLNPTENEPFSHSTCLALTWDEPHCNGAEITSYSISVGDRIITTRSVTGHIIRDLLPDSEYSLQIRAENEMGPGPFSQTLTVRTRPLPPSPPRLECAAVGPQSLKLRWGFSSRSQLTDDTTYILQMEDRNQRFVVVYRGPSHTFKLQRLSESSRYRFRIQTVSEAGEGPFSETYTFSTTKSLPQTLKAPRVVQLEGNACEVTWESIPPMRGDRISYVLQVLGGRDSDYKQVYKGDEASFQLSGLQWNTDYRVRVFACRRCVDTLQDLCGSFSPSTHFNLRRSDATLAVEADITRVPMGKTLSDEQFAGLIVFGVASLSVLMAFLLQLLI
uniref:Fibronectin type III domain-containing protein 3B-like n=1 Tax=Sinocyclocheilus anshuiensis TaxID=1608454 RepID=A0A671Q1K2_9TELE